MAYFIQLVMEIKRHMWVWMFLKEPPDISNSSVYFPSLPNTRFKWDCGEIISEEIFLLEKIGPNISMHILVKINSVSYLCIG